MINEMPSRLPENPDDRAARSSQFRITLTGIQSRPLSPANIDFYARDALRDLIRLTDSITQEYARGEASEFARGRELEDRAFAYFGLENLGQILDHVASTDSEIRRLGGFIQSARQIGHILVPPQEEMQPIVPGEEEFRQKLVIPRTKTVLFILSNDFNVDVEDEAQLHLTTGILSDGMMRQLSYFMINVPGLNRTILCCDEEGNVTYVFDNEVLSRHGLTSGDIANLTKPEINDLLENDPLLGQRVVYSRNFVPRMIDLMTNLEDTALASREENQGFYLYPTAPEGTLSRRRLAHRFGVNELTVAKAIEELGELLGESQTYRFHNNLTQGYTPEQQDMIWQNLSARGVFLEQAPKEVLSERRLAEKLGVNEKTVRRTIEELREQLEQEVRVYRFGSHVAAGLTPEQQEMIRQALERRGLFTETAPEGVTSLYGIAVNLGSDVRTIRKIVENLGETLGETYRYKFRNERAIGYTIAQQEMIIRALENKGLLVKKGPEEVKSLNSIAQEYGIDYSAIKRVIKLLGEGLGETTVYQFGTTKAVGYTPEQQKMIIETLDNEGFFAEVAPEGIISGTGLAKKFGVAFRTLAKAVEELEESLGETRSYRFSQRITQGYTPEQQEMIRRALENKGSFSEVAPEGALSAHSLANKLGISSKRLKKIIDLVKEDLGELQIYRFGSRVAVGFTPEQQETIRQTLERKGGFAGPTPKGFLSAKGLAELLGVGHTTIARIIGELGESLGETQKYKFSHTITTGYTPEQQELIKQAFRRRVNKS